MRIIRKKTDILRFEILYQFGGLHKDTDFECLKPIDDLIINRNIVLFL
jgi:mannosyltransferase OCH1-like enzyme